MNRIIFKVFNQTKQILYLELLKKAIQTISIIIGLINFNVDFLIIGFILSSFISYWINYYFSMRILGGINFNDFFQIIKIIVLSFLLTIVFNTLFVFFKINIWSSLFFLPFLVVTYFVGLKLMNILNLKKEYYNHFNKL
jgi:hypothetical protein